MASRRVRIKGLSHIPQRKKLLDGEATEKSATVAPEIEQKNGESNLTFAFEIAQEGQSTTALTEYGEHLVAKKDSHVENVSNPTQTEKDTGIEVQAAIAPLNEVSSTPKKPILGAPYRRLIRPGVSVGAVINRKTAEATINNSDANIPESDEKQMIPSEQKSNKIVILDNIITNLRIDPPTFVAPTTAGLKENSQILDKDLTKIPDAKTCPIISAAHNNANALVLQQQQQQQAVHSDSEYAAPPPSPTKLNRSRIKAVPRISQRHTSCSASESEADESVKSFNINNNKRARNDSVCSTNSQDNNTQTVNNANNITMTTSGGCSGAECASPQKQRGGGGTGGEYNAVLQRKCRRTEQSRKLAEARREFLMKFKNSKPDRQKLTMIDLIFYNPTTNLMRNENGRETAQDEVQNMEEAIEENPAEDDPAQSEEENAVPAPQLKIGPTGEIIIDEQSLYIENVAVKKARKAIEMSKLIDGDLRTGYGIYKKQKRAKDWTKNETLKFYRALNTFGTDFSTMCDFFPSRTRRELKLKFKKEEKINRALVDRAILEPSRMDFSEFKHAVEMEEKEMEVLRKQKEKDKELAQELRVQKEAEAKRRKQEKEEKARKVEEMSLIHNKTQENQDGHTESVTTPLPSPLGTTATNSAKPKQKKRGRKRKAALDIMNVLSGSDVSSSHSSDDGAASADRSASEDEENVEKDEEEEEDELQIGLLQGIQGPTRSGRIPKVTARYDPSAAILEGYDSPLDLVVYKPPTSLTRIEQKRFEQNSVDSEPPIANENNTEKSSTPIMEPGTLMLLETTGESGQTVCKVFMVTGDSQKGSTSTTSAHLSPDGAVDFNEGCISSTSNLNSDVHSKNGKNGSSSLSDGVAALQSLFTLTTTVISNNCNSAASDEIFDQGGITIPADEEDRGGITIPAEETPNVDTSEQQKL